MSALLLTAFAKLMENSRSMMCVKDAELRYVAASKNFIEAMGRDDFFGKTDDELFAHDDQHTVTGEERDILACGTDIIDKKKAYAFNGGSIYCLVSKHILRDENDNIIGLLNVYRSPSDARLVVENSRLMKEAERDAMTGLLNHGYTIKHLSSFLNGEGKMSNHALMFIDLDYFKDVNDTFGHLYGDKIIKKTADIIRGSFRGSDLIGRVGGDEFLVLMKNVSDADFVCHKAAELNRALAYSCIEGDEQVDVSASIGVAFYNAGDELDHAELMAQADGALYKAKEAGRNCYRVAEDETIYNDK